MLNCQGIQAQSAYLMPSTSLSADPAVQNARRYLQELSQSDSMLVQSLHRTLGPSTPGVIEVFSRALRYPGLTARRLATRALNHVAAGTPSHPHPLSLADHDLPFYLLQMAEYLRIQMTVNMVASMTHTPIERMMPEGVPLHERAGQEIEGWEIEQAAEMPTWLSKTHPTVSGQSDYPPSKARYKPILRAHSGSQANQIALAAAMIPGEAGVGLDLAEGGHLSHFFRLNISGILHRGHPYHVKADGFLDYEKIKQTIRESRARVVMAGSSAYSRQWDFARLRQIVDELSVELGYTIILVADIAHYSDQVMTGHHPSPFGYAHMITGTGQKSGFSRGGFLWVEESVFEDINRAHGLKGDAIRSVMLTDLAWRAANRVVQEDHLWPMVASKGTLANTWKSAEYQEYGAQVIALSRAFADECQQLEMHIESGGTDNHLVLVDTQKTYNLSGDIAERALEFMGYDVQIGVGMTANRNLLPQSTDPAKVQKNPLRPRGIRIGSRSWAARRMTEQDVRNIARWIHLILTHTTVKPVEETAKSKREPVVVVKSDVAKEVLSEIDRLTVRCPVPDLEDYADVLEGNLSRGWRKLQRRHPELAHRLFEAFWAQSERLTIGPTVGESPSFLPLVLVAMNSDVYAEGGPGDPAIGPRFYPGNGVNNLAELEEIRRFLTLFKADSGNLAHVQAHTHAQALLGSAMAVTTSPVYGPNGEVQKRGGKIVIVRTESEPLRYPSHGDPLNLLHQMYEVVVRTVPSGLNNDHLAQLIQTEQPQTIIYNPSDIDSATLAIQVKTIKSDTALIADLGTSGARMAHGLSDKPSPVGKADLIVMDTNPMGAGIGGGIVIGRSDLTDKEWADVRMSKKPDKPDRRTMIQRVQSAITPGIQGGPILPLQVLKGVLAGRLATREAIALSRRLDENRVALSDALRRMGWRGYTSHEGTWIQLKLDKVPGLTREMALSALAQAGIDMGDSWRITGPDEVQSVDIGLGALTQRGFGPDQIQQFARVIHDVLTGITMAGDIVNLESIQQRVKALALTYPAQPELMDELTRLEALGAIQLMAGHLREQVVPRLEIISALCKSVRKEMSQIVADKSLILSALNQIHAQGQMIKAFHVQNLGSSTGAYRLGTGDRINNSLSSIVNMVKLHLDNFDGEMVYLSSTLDDVEQSVLKIGSALKYLSNLKDPVLMDQNGIVMLGIDDGHDALYGERITDPDRLRSVFAPILSAAAVFKDPDHVFDPDLQLAAAVGI